VTSIPAGINCGFDCTNTYTHGTSVTLSASPLLGSTFTGWTGSGCSGVGSCTVSMTAARSVTASFALKTYLLTVSKTGTGSGTVTSIPAGINCGFDCTNTYTHGTSVTLSASASAGSTFTGWTGSGCSGVGSCTVSMTTTRSVTATFTVNSYTLSVSKAGTGSGTVTSIPAGINCGFDCTQSYTHGTSVTLSASASAGSTFTGWSGACTGTGSCTVSMTQARFVTASFALKTYLLTVISGSGDGSYLAGTVVTVTANAPPAGQVFDEWIGDTSAVANVNSATTTVTMPASNVTITATYQTLYTLTVNSGSGDGSYLAGTMVTVTANAPPAGQVFDQWIGDTSAVANVNSATTTVTMPASNVTITATYQTLYTLTVNSGSGDGSYLAGTMVTVTANAPPAGQVFDQWTGDTSTVANVNNASTTVTMPASNVTITATYRDILYTLTVISGSGDGSYTAGTVVPVSASAPPAGQVFDQWTGDTSTVANVNNASTTVTMPASNVTITATYIAA